MAFPSVLTADQAAGLIPDGATVTVSSSSGLGCPDAVLAAVGRRFDETGHPRRLTTLHPIAAGDMVRCQGHRPHRKGGTSCQGARRLLSVRAVFGRASCRLADDHRQCHSGLQHPLRHSLRHAPERPQPGDPVSSPRSDSTPSSIPSARAARMNGRAAAEPIVSRIAFADDTWLFFPTIVPTSLSFARRPRTSAAIFPTSTRAVISARSTRRLLCGTMVASSSPR